MWITPNASIGSNKHITTNSCISVQSPSVINAKILLKFVLVNNKATLIWYCNYKQCNCQSCCKSAVYLHCITVSSGGFEQPTGSSSSYHTEEWRLIIKEAHSTRQHRTQSKPMHDWYDMHLKNIFNPHIHQCGILVESCTHMHITCIDMYLHTRNDLGMTLWISFNTLKL